MPLRKRFFGLVDMGVSVADRLNGQRPDRFVWLVALAARSVVVSLYLALPGGGSGGRAGSGRVVLLGGLALLCPDSPA